MAFNQRFNFMNRMVARRQGYPEFHARANTKQTLPLLLLSSVRL